MRAYVLDPHSSLIAKRYDEIADIVSEHGLKQSKRRKSSATAKVKDKVAFTVVEYKDDNAMDEPSNDLNVCQREFYRFLSDNFSFCDDYLPKFAAAELNDIRYIGVIDLDTLLSQDIAMKRVHAKIMMTKIDKFKQENIKFIDWLHSIALQEYYKLFEQNGILTFESYYHHIQSTADLIVLLGDRNAFDVEFLSKSCPKFKRHNSLSSLYDVDNNDNESGDDVIETIDVNGNHQGEGV